MIDDVTRSLLDNLPRGGQYDLSVVPDADTAMQALTVTIDGTTHHPGIGYDTPEQFEYDREQIATYLVTRKQRGCGGCGGCSCG
jgi:hypothetical protein